MRLVVFDRRTFFERARKACPEKDPGSISFSGQAEKFCFRIRQEGGAWGVGSISVKARKACQPTKICGEAITRGGGASCYSVVNFHEILKKQTS
jgi:hypothetical protein